MLAFVNGMGGTPLLELYVMFAEVSRILGGHGISIERSLVGPYITSLEMAGCSITLLKLDEELTQAVGRPGSHAGIAVGDVSRGRRSRDGRPARGLGPSFR